jgi:hypothetical protein
MDKHHEGSVLLALRIMLQPFEANAAEEVACSNRQSWLETWTQSALKSAQRVPNKTSNGCHSRQSEPNRFPRGIVAGDKPEPHDLRD